jgi:death-on-curing protein
MPVLSLLGERGRDVLEGVLALPKQSAFGSEAYVGDFAKAAVLMRSIILNHPFMDGNKRMGLAGAMVFLLINQQVLCADDDELVEFTVSIAAGHEKGVDNIAEWIKARTIQIDAISQAADADDGTLDELVATLPGEKPVADRPLLRLLVLE